MSLLYKIPKICRNKGFFSDGKNACLLEKCGDNEGGDMGMGRQDNGLIEQRH
jgi:hypothetical protein